jgi:molybdopterin converting factor small subunit
MKILYINNDGGGFADYIEVEEGTNIEELFEQRVREGDSGDYLIRVNRQPVSRDYVLKDNDRVTFTPTKIEGAIQ